MKSICISCHKRTLARVGEVIGKGTGKKIVATQLLNVGVADRVAEVIGEKTGETITHEINEAFFGAQINPGGDYTSTRDKAHEKASKLDRVHTKIDRNENDNIDKNNVVIQWRKTGTEEWKDITKVPKQKK